MGKIITKQQFSVAPNSRAIPYPPVAAPTPTDQQIRELLRGYDEPGSVLPNAVLITDSNSKIQQLTIVGNLSLNGDGDTAINTLGKINQIDCGFFDEEQ